MVRKVEKTKDKNIKPLKEGSYYEGMHMRS